jgi:hypothetical protein
MQSNTLTQDEFFPDSTEPPPVQSERLTVLQRVVPKAEFLTFAGALTEALLLDQSAIDAYVRIRNVADILDMALGLIKERAMVSMQGTAMDVLGAKVQLKALPKKYEYQDGIIGNLEAQKKAIEEKLKARKKLLENLSIEVADPGTGEIIRPAKCISAGSTIQVTF